MGRAVRSAASRRALAAALAVLAIGVPTAAYPISIAQLLQLPLEQLLRLEITASAVVGGVHHGR
jgi:predicted Kef-type K+ transport protein